MTNKIFKPILTVLVAAIIITSCFDGIETQIDNTVTQQLEDGGPTVLGRKLENPFTVETMREAYSKLRTAAEHGRGRYEEIEIRTTHFYVKFLPQDSNHVEKLEKDDQLNLYDYPLDYEIITPGNYYRDPNTPINRPTPQYTAVPVDYQFNPDVPYEILEELYLPSTDRENTSLGRTNKNSFLEDLEDEALRMTGNLTETSTAANGRTGSRRYNPQGVIRVSMGANTYQGVPNIKARVRRWFEVRTAMTNANGYFFISESFRHDVNYGFQFENNHAFVKPTALGFGPAFIDGPKSNQFWEYSCERGTNAYLWSVIMVAVYDYYVDLSRRFGIDAPPNGLKIRACGNNSCGVATMMHQNGRNLMGPLGAWLFSDIRIGDKNQLFYRIYETTIHELGHAAHWKYSGDWFIGNNLKIARAHMMVREAWACAVEDQASLVKFGRLAYKPCEKSLSEYISTGYINILGRDLIDDVEEFDFREPGCNVRDKVSGFTLGEIFQSLRGVTGSSNNDSMDEWRDNLANRRPSQQQNLIDYFNQFKEGQ